MTWAELLISADGTHHVRSGQPAYASRFECVGKFHEPGLAPVRDSLGAFHVAGDGRPAYEARFERTFGFYEGLAAVVGADGWFHIEPRGATRYRARFAWCGNFQDGRCVVRTEAGLYCHIDQLGVPVYEERYRYAGDFRDGVGCVQDERGLYTHIDHDGREVHGRWYSDLDVFHKGFARARDERGWHHIDRSGRPLYSERYEMVEPFYNGQARVGTARGRLSVIDESGAVRCEIRGASGSELGRLSDELVGFWRTQTIRAAVELGVFDALPGCSFDLPEDSGRRLLRALEELRLVKREQDGQWHATERGALLSGSARDVVRHWSGEIYEAWIGLAEALRTGQPQFAARFGQAYFDWIGADAERSRRDRSAMAAYAAEEYEGLAQRIPVARHRTIIDAGGGDGAVLRQLLAVDERVAGVLMDMPQTVAGADDLGGRIRLVGADLFDPWPVEGDAIVLARVLHDWSDERALAILRRARTALESGGALYCVERILDPEGCAAGLLDLHMLVTTGGCERTRAEFESLLADSGFQLAGVRELPSGVALMEASAR